MWRRRREGGRTTCGCCGEPCVRAVETFCRGCRQYLCDRPTCNSAVSAGAHGAQAHRAVATTTSEATTVLQESAAPTPHVLHCPQHGPVFLVDAEYERQLPQVGNWRCPRVDAAGEICGAGAWMVSTVPSEGGRA